MWAISNESIRQNGKLGKLFIGIGLKCFPWAVWWSLASSNSESRRKWNKPIYHIFPLTLLPFFPQGIRYPEHSTQKWSICIDGSYVVLASCVIEVCINIRADDVTTWFSVLRRELWPAVRDHAYEVGSPQVRSCWAVTRKFPGAE